MNAGRQKSLSKHFLVLLSFSTAPEAACQQTYDEKEENRGEEVHNRLFLWGFFFCLIFDCKGSEVLFAVSDCSLLPIKGPPPWLWQTWTITRGKGFINRTAGNSHAAPFLFFPSILALQGEIGGYSITFYSLRDWPFFRPCTCGCPAPSQCVSLPAPGHIEASAAERSSTLSFHCQAWKFHPSIHFLLLLLVIAGAAA